MLTSVAGNGSIVTVASTRGLSGDAPRTPVKCGTKGTACASEIPPGGTMTMKAVAAPGYRFDGWKTGCTGKSSTCTFKAGGSTTTGSVSASFVPTKPNRSLVVRLRPPSINAKFKASTGQGTLRVDGSITLRARLRIQLRRPGGGPLLTKNVTALGSFRLKSLLKKGRLAGGAQLFPGAFVLSVTGRAGNTPVPLQMRTIFLKSPREGVVRSAYGATLEDGVQRQADPARLQPSLGRLQVRDAADVRADHGELVRPERQARRDAHEEQPAGHLVRNRQRDSGAIPSGTYKVVLKAGRKMVKTVRIRVA